MGNRGKWMLAIKIWVAIYPSITLVLFFFDSLLASLPLYQKTFILTIVLVPWMVFILLPLLEKLILKISSNG